MKSSGRIDLEAVLDALVERVAARLVATPPHTPRYYDAKNNPLGRRAFLDAARRGAFPSFKIGKKVLAEASAVEAWIAAHRRVIETHSEPAPTDETDALLAQAGLLPTRVPLP